MNKAKSISILLNGIYFIVAVLFVSDMLTKVEISNGGLKLFVYYGVVFLTVPILIWNYITSKPRFISMSLPALLLALLLIIGPTEILSRTSTWKTQEIHHENRNFSFIKIVYQMQDNGASGYNKRTVQLVDIAGVFAIVSKAPQHIDTQTQWQPVYKYIGQQRIKYP